MSFARKFYFIFLFAVVVAFQHSSHFLFNLFYPPFSLSLFFIFCSPSLFIYRVPLWPSWFKLVSVMLSGLIYISITFSACSRCSHPRWSQKPMKDHKYELDQIGICFPFVHFLGIQFSRTRRKKSINFFFFFWPLSLLPHTCYLHTIHYTLFSTICFLGGLIRYLCDVHHMCSLGTISETFILDFHT